MNRRDLLKTLPLMAVGAALAPRRIAAQAAGRRIPLGIQYGGPVADPDGNKMKMQMYKDIGYDMIEPTGMRGFDPKLFRKQADEVGLGLHSIHLTSADTSAPPARGQAAGPGGQTAAPGAGRGGGRAAGGGGQAGPPAGAAGGGRGDGGQATLYAKNGRALHSNVVAGQDVTYTNEGIIAIVKAYAPILRDLGVTYGVLGASSLTSYETVDNIRRMADTYNQAHKLLRAVGVNLSHHTHEFELWPVEDDGRIGLEVLWQNTDPTIKTQVDIGWAAWGGADVVSFIRNHTNRIGLLHMRDLKDGAVTTAGEGVFHWPEIFKVTQLLKDPLCYVEGGDAKIAFTDLQKFGWGHA